MGTSTKVHYETGGELLYHSCFGSPKKFCREICKDSEGNYCGSDGRCSIRSICCSSVVVSSGCIIDANTYVSDFCNLSAGSIILSSSALMEPMEIPAGEAYRAESQSDIKSIGMPSYKKDDEWVQK